MVDVAGHEVTVGGIYSATAMLIISSLVVYGALFIKQRKLEKSQWLTLIACLVFGSLTLAFHSETFLKWKAPVVNWLFAVAFIGSHFIGDRLLIKRIMGHALTLPDPVWTRLNIAWIAFPVLRGRQPVRRLHLPELLGGLQGVRQPGHDPDIPGRTGHLPVAPSARCRYHNNTKTED